jgi:transcription elongation factor Elf1
MDAKLDADKLIAELLAEVDHKEQFLDEHHNCPLCGSEMLITHVTQFIQMKVKEEANCEACKIQVRDLNHQLQ